VATTTGVEQGAAEPRLEPGTIVELFRAATDRHRGRPALRRHRSGAWSDVSYDDLGRRVARVAAGLIALGVAPGDRVGLLCNTRPEWTECDFGILCAGATVVPVYPSNSPAECLHVLRDSGARAVICEDATQLDKVTEVRAQAPALVLVVVIDGDAGDAAMSYDALCARGDQAARSDPGALAARADAVSPDDACTIVYTSGTTGAPKGCVILHRNFRAMVEMAALIEQVIDADAIVYLYLPLAHVFARLTQFWCIHRGCVIAYTRGIDRIADDLVEVRPTAFPSVPRIFEKVHAAVLGRARAEGGLKARIFDWSLGIGEQASRLREQGGEPARALAIRLALADRLVLSKVRARLGGRLEVCISGGAPIAPEILRFFHACGILVCEGYGMTESSTAISINRPTAYRFGSVGLPFPGGEVRIAADGEVLFRGPNVFAGYHLRDDETAATIVDGWLHTGDIGSVHDDGFLSITDRKKDIIVTAGGENVTPSNLENGLKTSPYVAEACVLGDRRPYLVALVTLDAEELERFATAHGLTGDHAALCRAPAVAAVVDAQVVTVNADVARVAQIKRYRILTARFSQETGELTPTLKLKRKVIAERYAADIDELYAPR